jgi:hypothetical protein
MVDFNYKEHEPPPRPFKVGDVVELIDSQGTACGTMNVSRAGPKIVRVKDGRRYVHGDGRWFSDGRAWPFPWIRLSNDGEAKL